MTTKQLSKKIMLLGWGMIVFASLGLAIQDGLKFWPFVALIGLFLFVTAIGMRMDND